VESRVVDWDTSRLGDLEALCALALPDESLVADDLELVARDGVVLGHDDGTAAILLTWDEDDRAARLQLVAVHPSRRRRGLARMLVHAGEDWADDRGAVAVTVGGSGPLGLFRGVDTRWTEALCLFESLDYLRGGPELDLVCPTMQRTRRVHPPGVSVVHVESDSDVDALARFSDSDVPDRCTRDAFSRAGGSGTALIAVDVRDGHVVGALAHSVSRIGVLGPLLVTPAARRHGIGAALLATALADLSTAGLHTAEIRGSDELGFFVGVAGARVGRVSQQYRRELPRSPEG